MYLDSGINLGRYFIHFQTLRDDYKFFISTVRKAPPQVRNFEHFSSHHHHHEKVFLYSMMVVKDIPEVQSGEKGSSTNPK